MAEEDVLAAFYDAGCSVTSPGRRVNPRPLLSHVNLTVSRGEFVGIVGPSGCCKTTLINLLLGRWTAGPSFGTAELRTSRVAVVPACPLVTAGLTVRETLEFAAALRGVSESRATRIQAAINAMALDADYRLSSSTEKSVTRRVAVAAELLADVDLLLLDEPCTGLDSKRAAELVQLLERLTIERRNLAVVMTVHQPRTSVVLMFSKLVLLGGGRVLYAGPPRGVTSHLAAALGGVEKPPIWSSAEFALEVALAASTLGAAPETINCGAAAKSFDLNVIHQRVAAVGVDALAAFAAEKNAYGAAGPGAFENAVKAVGPRPAYAPRPCVSWATQCQAVAARQFTARRRDWLTLTCMAVTCVLQALLVSAVFWQLPDYVGGLTPIQIIDIVNLSLPSFLANGTIAPWLISVESPLYRVVDRGIDGRGDAFLQSILSPEVNAYWEQPIVNLALDTLDGLHAGWNVTAAWDYPATEWETGEGYLEVDLDHRVVLDQAHKVSPDQVHKVAPDQVHKVVFDQAHKVSPDQVHEVAPDLVHGLGRSLRTLHTGDFLYHHYPWDNVSFCEGYADADMLTPHASYWLCYALQTLDLVGTSLDVVGFGPIDNVLRLVALATGHLDWITQGVPRPSASSSSVLRKKSSLQVAAESGRWQSPAWWHEAMQLSSDKVPRRRLSSPGYDAPSVDEVLELFRRSTPAGIRELLKSSGWYDLVERHIGVAAVDLLPALQSYADVLGTERCRDPLCGVLEPFVEELGWMTRLVIQWLIDGYVSASTMFNVCGVVFFISLFIGFTAYDVVLAFPRDRRIFNREQRGGLYSCSAYYVGRQLGDLPFQLLPATILSTVLYFGVGLHRIGGKTSVAQFCTYLGLSLLISSAAYGFGYAVSSVAASLRFAVMLAPTILIAWLCVAGFFLRDADVSPWLGWIKYLSFYRWGFFGHLSALFRDGGSFGSLSSEFAKALAGVTEDRLAVNCLMLVAVNLGYRVLGFLGLKFCHRRLGVEG